ncbi:MAG: putative Ig domain-containing protein [Candidatus Aenigmarchaeota archaeon]|nr:putative Ig domain-containing protein [Candidatus Aenigmarchaeota archaeon]
MYDDDEGINSGSAYIFEKDAIGNRVEQEKLIGTGGSFGNSVSLYENITVVGAPLDNENTSQVGAVYIFSLNKLNHTPTLSTIGDKTIIEGTLLEFILSSTDPDGDNLTYSAANLPSGATFSTTGTFSWTPGYDQEGNYTNIEFTIMDDGEPMELDVELITITVGNVNRTPVFDLLGTQEILENELLEFIVTATDSDGDDVTLSASNTPDGATFDPTTEIFLWTPDNTQAGVHTTTFTATDDGIPSETSILEVSITVGDVPTPVEQAEDLVDVVVEYDFLKEIENSYLANLKKVARFIEEGKITPAIKQLDAFIVKVEQDVINGDIDQTVGDELIAIANTLLEDLL